jgi:hypothetical protein
LLIHADFFSHKTPIPPTFYYFTIVTGKDYFDREFDKGIIISEYENFGLPKSCEFNFSKQFPFDDNQFLTSIINGIVLSMPAVDN